MINVSREFLEEMKTRTDFKQVASVRLSDGTILNIDSSDFSLSNNNIVDGAGESSIPLGAAIEKSIQLEINNDDGKYSDYDFLGAEITLFLNFELSNSTESIDFGKFTVLTPYTRGTTIIITAVDDMYKADVPYDTLMDFPATIGAMLRDSCSATGISLHSSEFNHNDFIVSEKPNGFTHRQIIGFISMIACGNARINRFGYLEITSYDLWKNNTVLDGGNFSEWLLDDTVDGGTFDPWTTGIYVSGGEFSDFKKYHVLSEWLNDPRIDTDDITITGIQTTYTEEDTEKNLLIGEEGYVLKVENPLIAGKEQEALEYIAYNLVGSTFRQFEGDHVSYPLAEFMDAVIVVDRSGNIYNSFITDIDFAFLGMTIFKNSAESALANGRSYSSAPAEVLRKAKQMVSHEKTEREKAVEQLQESLENSSGMYITPEEQLDGSVIYYAHNKPTLAESDIVWKYTAEVIAVSTDGGKTYPYGFTVTGDAVTKILSTEGINANWINTGYLSVKDDNGATLFLVDIDTKQVIISGDSVIGGTLMLGGKNNSNGILEVYDSTGKLVGNINNNGIGFISKDEDNYERVVEMKNGGLYFSKAGTMSGLIRRIAWGNNYDSAEGIMFATHSKYLAIGYHTGTGYGAGYIVNNGLNPDGNRERNVFYGNARFINDVYFNGKIRFPGSAYLSYNSGTVWVTSADLYVNGDIMCSGEKNRIVNTENYGARALNAFETAESYFSDIGSGTIDASGNAVIEFESIFSETVETDIPYQIFITPTSELDCRCIKKERKRFIMSGDPGATFDYMICAKQKGYANTRLKKHEYTNIF